MKTFFVADLHFGHQKVSELRGFSEPKDHDECIVRRWKSQVTPQDRVYVLGDISGGGSAGEDHALDLIKSLPGEKHLISGNHDSVSGIHREGWKQLGRFQEVFASVRDFARIRLHKTDVFMSHYPYAYEGDGKNRDSRTRYAQFRPPFLGAPLIHGHTHSEVAETDRFMYCVSWDAHRRLATLKDVEQHFFGKGSDD